MLACYTLAYGGLVALPLLILAAATLWSRQTTPAPKDALILMLVGFGAAVAICILWGLDRAPVSTGLFDLQPDTVPIGPRHSLTLPLRHEKVVQK